MGILETALIYLLIGIAVGAALILREPQTGLAKRVMVFAVAVALWPFFASVLLAAPAARPEGAPRFADRIAEAQAQLLQVLDHVQGVAEVVAPEVARVRGLAGAVASMQRRVGEMDQLRGTREFNLGLAQTELAELLQRGIPASDPRAQSVQARVRNIERLQAMRERTYEDLERIALRVEEMSSRLQLLKFAGRPDAEVVQLFKEVAESVAEISEGILEAG